MKLTTTLIFGGYSGGRDSNYIRYTETRRTAEGVYFERVWHKRKKGVNATADIPQDYTRIIPESEIESKYAPYQDKYGGWLK